MPRITEGISRFALYGEQQFISDPEFIHIEDIRSRARLYNWRIAPHIHAGMFQTVFALKGKASVSIDQAGKTIHGPCAVCIPGGVVHSFSFEPNTVGWVLTVSERLLDEPSTQAFVAPFNSEAAILSFAENPEDAARIAAVLKQLHDEFQRMQLGRATMLEWLLRILLLKFRRHLDIQTRPETSYSEKRELFARFRHLLEEHYREHWAVTAYADALSLSQGRLNRLCKTITGKGVNEIIQDRVSLEAQRHLIYTSAPAAMIAFDLGFQDPAYFSRFFKRHTGMAPKQFRRAKHAEHAIEKRPASPGEKR